MERKTVSSVWCRLVSGDSMMFRGQCFLGCSSAERPRWEVSAVNEFAQGESKTQREEMR